MNQEFLQRLTSGGEGQYLEFKKKANFPEKILKELVAFANTEGGRLVLGVDDDGTVSGTRNIEGEVFILEDSIHKLIRPKLNYSKSIFHINEKKGVAVFEIPESRKKPHFVKESPNTRKGIAFVRSEDESLKASKEMREIMRRRNKERDEQFNYGEKERILMQLLDQSPSISLSQFSTQAKIPKHVASRTLIKLVLANVIDIKAFSEGDRYFIKSPE